MDPTAYIAQLEEANRLLQVRVEKLEKLLAEALAKIEELTLKKNSRNSSLPPSSDFKSKVKSLRQKTGKKPGGQPGHQGHTLLMQQEPDERVELISDYCSNCGTALAAVEPVLVEKRQLIDLPVIKPVCTQYEQYERICPCCAHKQRPEFAAHLTNHVQYGENVHSLAVYLNVRQYMPYQRMREFFASCCHLPISMGTLENIQLQMAAKGEEVYEALRQQVSQAKVVGADETGLRVAGENQWAWSWQNQMITFIAISVSRGAGIIRRLFPQGFTKAVLICDRWRAHLSTPAKGHQLCLAHLLRELNYLSELYKDSNWASSFSQLLREAVVLKQLSPSYEREDERVKQIEQEIDKLLTLALDKERHPKLHTFQKSINTYRPALLVFLYDPLVEYDNNASERAIRNFKVKLKVSGQFRSAQRAYGVLRSISDTAIKNRQPVMQVCRALFCQKIAPAV